MKTKLYLILLVLIASSLSFTACEKEITLDLPEEASKIVVEAWIEQGLPASVIITKTAPYFSPIDSSTLSGSVVSNAVVKLSDGIAQEQLAFTIDPNFFPFLMYKGSAITGEVGKTYYLTIEVEGYTFTAETTIPPLRAFDSVWFKLDPGKDSAGLVYAQGTDDGSGLNYYRVFTKRTGRDFSFVPIYGSVWDDKFFQGQTFTAQLYRGLSSNIMNPDADDKHFGHYLIGDTVITRLCTIDYNNYLFWRAAESEIYSGGNPFSSTTSIPSNIAGGALGTFTGYGATYDTVYCAP